jgi:cbb3-type cytochrome oxidase subunit 3
MVRDVLGWLDYSACAEASLLGFILVFIAVTVHAMTRDQKTIQQNAEIVLDDFENRERKS